MIFISWGDIRLNLLFENGFCRCHGRLSPIHSSNGDIARVTDELECIYQRIGVWLAVKKGERPLFPNFGCCIWSFVNRPLTMSNLKQLKGLLQSELEELFPEYIVSNLRVTVPERNTTSVSAQIGAYPVEFLGNPATLNQLESQLARALKDLGMTR